MGYINYSFKIFLMVISCQMTCGSHLFSQTCCSGGVPLSGNIGFKGSGRGTLQTEVAYDLNYLATLKSERELFQDQSRRRVTHSVLWKAGYSITHWLAVDGLFSYVVQGRRITYTHEINKVSTSGIGDAVVIIKFLLSQISENGTEIQLGAGPKIPFGRSDLTGPAGITLNADLQPGSGSWDLVGWGYYARQLTEKPGTIIYARVTGRINGVNNEYLGTEKYKFGNAYQVYGGVGNQLVIKNMIFTPSVALRYRRAFPDRINGRELDNTGGEWVNLVTAIGWNLAPRTILNFIPEIPLYSHVEGMQLTPTFRIQAGIYHHFGPRNESQTKTYQL